MALKLNGSAVVFLFLCTVGGSSAITCLCNKTFAIPHPECFHNSLTCDVSPGLCYAKVLLSSTSNKEVREWGCKSISEGPGVRIELLVNGFCKLNETDVVVKCCNDTDMCNRGLNVSLPNLMSTSLHSTLLQPTLLQPTLLQPTLLQPTLIQPTLIQPTLMSSAIPHTANEEDTELRGTRGHEYNSLFLGLTIMVAVIAVVFIIALGTVIVWLLRNRKGTRLGDVSPSRYRNNLDGMSLEFSEATYTTLISSESSQLSLTQTAIARSILIDECIGCRQHAPVYLGRYGEEYVAVRRYGSSQEKYWAQETKVLNTILLQSENIVSFVGSDIVSNNCIMEFWLITQFQPNRSLHDYLPRNVLSPKVTLAMATSICSGLAHLHTEVFGAQTKPSIAHRGITSRNILVKDNLTCCIADFHIAVVKELQGDAVLTAVDLSEGNTRYMAPEILEGEMNVKYFGSYKQVDVYALGLVLWEICRRCAGYRGTPEAYELPFQGLVPPDPSFEDMRRLVVIERRQPSIPERWKKDQLLRELSKMMQECWYAKSLARPSSVYMKKKLIKLSSQTAQF